ncbi:MAG TPA: xanthine dehydrogenase family protein subunit M [Candidatus Bathyarchaeia archaeon]|nr:xanthine dehydrogenase family protein subunit M [Candidatus Bathyarchaeia archaeon]
MYPRSFEYFSPQNLGEALEYLNQSAEARILAGGQSLIPALKLRTRSVRALVDITPLKELRYIRQEGGVLRLGALTTVATVATDQKVMSLVPILREAAEQIADPLVRNRGTIGGNLCQADPTNDLPAVMLALNATVLATSLRGIRRMSADSFFVGSGRASLARDEILTEIEVPVPGQRTGSAYRKVKKGSGGFSIAGAATCLSVADGSTVDRCRIGLSAVGPTALRARDAERTLIGNVPTPTIVDRAAERAVNASQPSDDLNASKAYRRTVLHTLVKDSITASYEVALARNGTHANEI